MGLECGSGYSSIVATKNQVSSDLGGGCDSRSQIWGVLRSEVGTRIWNLIQEPKTLNEIQGAILEGTRLSLTVVLTNS